MKRSRDESWHCAGTTRGIGLAGKRVAARRPNYMEYAATEQRPDPDAYVMAVRKAFQDDLAKYDDFMETLNSYREQRLDTAGVMFRVKDLFRGHLDLMLGFNDFLPTGYEICPPLEEGRILAINYINKIKKKFEAEKHVYIAFLETMRQFQSGSKTDKSFGEVCQKVATLFRGHTDLLEEFSVFCPQFQTVIGNFLPCSLGV